MSTDINALKVGQPRVTGDGKWYVFPHTTMSNIDFSDCDDTVNGVCHKGGTLQNCIDRCGADSSCKYGYYLELPDNKSICVPLVDRNTSPYFRMRTQDVYPEMRDTKSYFYSQKNAYPYPADAPGTMYFGDHFLLKNLDVNKTIGVDEANVVFNDDDIITQFLPSDVTNDFIENYVGVKHGGDVTINIPGTAMILRQNDTEKEILWLARASNYFVPNNTFQIYSTSPGKKVGEALAYTEQFYFTFQGKNMVYDLASGRLITDATRKTLFQLVPLVQVYYCDGDCRSIILSQTDMTGFDAMYRGRQIYRSPVCWGTCERRKSHMVLLLVCIMVAVCVGGLILYRYRRKKR